ncbi:dmX-like protein 1 isoform X1 [Polyodon spathula]|uniref:dmX-like protein 1 isoform X1 n=1 Tax=Polyodon spathula TaxID=7913 RepID=UPI001B7EE14B|nr:dmX-like protein 1 isoform X1 [Polyodon spathula]XP_041105297.1 dmX-like protein 1 isoform X1 [Polyodon spathula]
MNLHQVLTGAVNPGDNCFAVGNINDQPFTAYASGCDIVILGSNFERLQIIPGAKHGNILVGCVDCSMQQGKIAASYGNVVCIFEPVQLLNRKNTDSSRINCQWQRSGQFVLQSIVHNLAWDPTGTNLLTGSNSLQLWSNVGLRSCIEEEEKQAMTINNGLGNWKCIWLSKTASSVHLMKFSPEGDFFATAGKDDCLVKVWYHTSSWQSGVTSLNSPPEKAAQGEVNYSFVYLAHPRTVTGFSWRKTSKYMPRGSVCNVLVTCCKDSVCRLWAETLLPSDSLLSGHGPSQSNDPVTSTSGLKRHAPNKHRVQNALELNLKHSRRGRKSPAMAADTGCLPHQQDTHEAHRNNSSVHANALCHFHIAASINPATDIPLLPSITSMSLDDDGEDQNGPFVVHWLNNKELHFTLSMEVFLQQLRKSLEQQPPETSGEEPCQPDEDAIYKDEQKGSTKKSEYLNAGALPLPAATIDHEIEILLAEWNKNADMMFSIHPMDGSLLVWHVDWLDEYQPGMFRQVQVSFVSRIPVAFPTGDANSLSRSIVMYACTKNVDLAVQQGKQKPPGMIRSSSMLISFGNNKSSSSLKLSIFTPNVLMISKHADGSLNQWAVSFAEESAFSTVLSVSHKSRYCGHRFHLNDLACHSVLPLLLTTSHHNALRTPEVDSMNDNRGLDNTMPRDPLSKRLNRVSVDATFQDPHAIYSELILWRVDPVGPLSFSGGVSELARINSLHVSAFSNVAWLPTLIPSDCLGAYGNSPSACFVASDGRSLRLYQAVIEAKTLLSELSNPDISKYVSEVFNIVSQQSTARPGCIIELDAITALHGRETQLLHVFEEDFILGKKMKGDGIQETEEIASSETGSQKGFSQKFYLVVIEYTQSGCSLLHMWHLHLKSVQITEDDQHDKTEPQSLLSPQDGQNSFSPEKSSSPLSQKYKACRTNLHSASRLTLISERVYSQQMKLPDRVEIIRATPSAGHLSSCSIHPTGLAPYLLATSCSDGKVRFWRCRVDPESLFSKVEDSGRCSYTYIWEEWPLLIEDGFLNSSTVSVMGRPIEVSCCNTSRIAVAYKQTSSQYCGKYFTMHVGIFECESTGGSQWILEQTLNLDEPSTMLDPRISIDRNLTVYNKQDVYLSSDIHVMPSAKHLIYLDWVSREDGSHILTVGIGSKLLLYGQLSGKIPEKGSKEGPAASALPMWEGAKDHSYSRFVLLRSVDLVASFEGSLPLPVSLSWVRDGILVVGMDCEMHVYSQWQPPAKSELTTAETDCGSTTSLITSIRQGHANGVNQKPAKKTLTRSMTSLAQKLSGMKTMYDLPVEMEDNGLFEAAHDLFPTLPQYHPVQLMELMDLGKVRRAKAILSHLVKCIAGEVVALKDNSTNHERRLRSLSISASGSTARDPKTFSKTENSDYTEIDSIPPLPLYALLAADEDTSHKVIDKSTNSIMNKENREAQGDDYDELFQTPSLGTDDFGLLDTDDEEDTKPKVIDLSQYSPTYFGPEHAQVLSSHLLHSSLPGLTRMEQMSLMALADTIATTSTDVGESRHKSTGGETLDECGLKFILAMRLHTFLLTSLPPAHRSQLLHQGLSTCHFSWAFHSEAEEELLNMLPAMQKGNPTWSELRAMGVGWWVRNTNTLRRCIEKVAKAAFQRNNDPLDAAIYYLAMKKKAVVWGLYRSQRDSKMTPFFNNNFSEDRWRKAALKNAFALLGKQRFEHSAAFFLLAGSLNDAVEVCLEKMNDIQLALVISRLYESEFEVSSTYKNILQKRILGYDSHERTFTLSQMHQDPFFRSMAYWILEDYSKALDTLLEQPVREEDDAGHTGVGTMSYSCNPMVFNFYNYLRTHPLLLRRHFASSEKPSTKMGLTVENSFADTINLVERRLFFTAAHAHFKAGCPMLALEVLSKMPKVVKKSKPLLSKESSSLSEGTKDSLLSPETKQEKDSDCDWSQTVVNGFGLVSHCLTNGQSESVLSLDWSQSSLIVQDEALDLNWDSDKEHETDDEESGLSMKDIKTKNNNIIIKGEPDNSSAYTDSRTAGEVDVITPSEDTIAAQLKFSACLKILTTELRTLSTGYEVDGGKLRYQLYHWLEREVVALQKACDYNPDLEDLEEGIAGNADETVTGQSAEDLVHQQRSIQQKDYLQKRRLWLLKNQPLFRMFLSYCSLHGSHGGGLGSVRMELILLLQESQQESSTQTALSPVPHQTSIPLLLACTASAKTVVANPVVYLTNLAHDILHTIIDLDSPPHPDSKNNKVYVMHTLAASLSACIYQCLCNSHSYSASHANQFTGIIYQSFLLTHQHPVRTMSLDETVTPNTSPAQWPGIVALIRLLNSSGKEDQPGLTVLLCEILTAVFLSLFVHGLATHSSNELFRIVAHPLNSKMWAAVFGGGARIPVKEQSPKKPATGRPFSIPSPHQVVVFSMECVGFSKSLTAISTHRPTSPAVTTVNDESEKHHKRFKLLSTKGASRESLQSPTSPVVNQKMPVFREKFIPPELSIWDYFIAKPFLPPSESRVEYDSEESQGSDDEDDDDEEEDVYVSETQLQEHSNPNSYSWSLMRLAMVQMVLYNLKTFYPIAGHDLSELPVGSPLCHSILKTLQRWEQVLLKRLEIFGGPPSKFISSHTLEDAVSPGPAILRHKALLEPTNTPFKSKQRSALTVKRLWQYLVKQDEVQETFIRNIFTKKRGQNELIEDHNENAKNTMMEEPNINKIEADLGYPGGKARIIHKESDIITAFAINKANRNCIAIASTHDIQELDVSAILATQILTWVDDEVELENKGSEDFLMIHARDDLSCIQGTTPYTHSSPGTPINMPWLGGMQTGRGASVLIKRNINNARRMASHPTLPYYLTGAQDGSVRMFEWGHSQQIICFRPPGNSRVTRIRFNYQGNKFGIVDADGCLSFWQTNTIGSTPKPYLTLQCHNKTANDFVFVGSSSLIATAGQSSDNRNVCLWDTLVTPANSLVHAFICHDSGATVLTYAPKHQLLISGGRKGFVCVFELHQRQQRQTFQAHDSPVKAVAVDPTEEYFITGSAEGSMKVWSLSTHSLIHTFINEHARQSIFRNIGTGVMQIEAGLANHIFSCGADGTVKMRILPDCFSTMNGVKNDVKCVI